MEGNILGSDLKRYVEVKNEYEEDKEKKARIEALKDEWQKMYPCGFDCVCCDELMCATSDFVKRSNAYADESSDGEFDDPNGCCIACRMALYY